MSPIQLLLLSLLLLLLLLLLISLKFFTKTLHDLFIMYGTKLFTITIVLKSLQKGGKK